MRPGAVEFTTVLAVLTLAPPGAAGGQAIAFPQPDTAAIELRLAKDPGFARGQAALVRGTAGPGGQRFRLGGLQVTQPVIATVLARDDLADVKVTILKPGRESPSLSGSTRGAGSASISTRTQGALDLLVQAPAETPFALLVWVGDEIAPRLGSVIVRPEQVRPGSSSKASLGTGSLHGSSRGTILGALLVTGALGAVTLVVLRRRHE